MSRVPPLRALLLAGAVTALMPSLAAGPSPRLATFRCDVTPPLGEPLIWDTPRIAVDTPLWAKGLVLESGGERLVFCTFDWCEISNETELAFRTALAKAARTDPSRVVVHSVHQHAAPYADAAAHRLLDRAPHPPLHLSDAFLNDVQRRLATALKRSLRQWQSFDHVGFGQARVERVASARRLRGETGNLVVRFSGAGRDPAMAAAPEGAIDPWLRTITLARGTRPLARLHCYASHPQTFSGNGHASADFVGQAREEMERREGVPQLYFTGCSGDVTVGKYNDGSPAARDALAERLLGGMNAARTATRWIPVPAVQWRTASVVLPARTDAGFSPEDCRARLNDPKASPGARVYQGAIRLAYGERVDRPLQLSCLQLGPVHLLCLPGEPMLDFQNYARDSLPPDGWLAVAGYCDCGPGYLCTDQAFREGGYEPTATHVGPGSEAVLKAAIRNLLQPASRTQPPRS